MSDDTAISLIQIAASPTMKLIRQAEQAAKLAPKLDANSPALAPFQQAERYGRELERLAKLKPTTWEPPEIQG